MPDRWAFVPCALNLTQSLVVDLPQSLEPCVVARTKPVVDTGACVVAFVSAPVTRVVFGCLHHTRSLELGALTCPYAVTASGSPPLLDFACHPSGRGRSVLLLSAMGASLCGRPYSRGHGVC